MEQFTLYMNGKQIDCFMESDNDSAIGWVESYYPVHEFGENTITLYRNVNGAGIHVATFAML
jgi:hypothetical protein